MFGSYAQVLRRPGALRFTAAGFLARMQMSMMGLGAVMLLSAERELPTGMNAAGAAFGG